jgi:hypothetical protein
MLGSNFIHDHNLYQLVGNGILGANWTADATDKSGDPKFVDAAGGNYQLSAGSPALNMGTTLGYTLDLLGAAVPSGSGPDAGAYEKH